MRDTATSRAMCLVVLATATMSALGCDASPSAPIPALGTLPIASIDINALSSTLQVDQTIQLHAVPRDSLGRALDSTVTWSADNRSPITGTVLMKQDGSATGNAPGPVTITAAAGRRSSSLVLTVTNIPVDSISISPGGFFGPIGSSMPFTVELYSAPPRKSVTTLRRQYAWAVSDHSIVSLDSVSLFPLGQASPSRPFAFVTGHGKATLTVTVEGKSVSFFVSGS